MSEKIKSLYKLSRKIFFEEIYFCMHCQMLEYNKHWLREHIKFEHDIHSDIIRMFICKKCNSAMIETDILHHLVKSDCM